MNQHKLNTSPQLLEKKNKSIKLVCDVVVKCLRRRNFCFHNSYVTASVIFLFYFARNDDDHSTWYMCVYVELPQSKQLSGFRINLVAIFWNIVIKTIIVWGDKNIRRPYHEC